MSDNLNTPLCDAKRQFVAVHHITAMPATTMFRIVEGDT